MPSKIYCPVNAWDCPYWNENGTCGMWPENDPVEECDDFAFFWDAEDDYIVEEEEYFEPGRPIINMMENNP